MLPKAIRDAALARQGETLEGASAAILEFGKRVIDVVAPHAPAVKPQVAFYEQYGWPGSCSGFECDPKFNESGSPPRHFQKSFTKSFSFITLPLPRFTIADLSTSQIFFIP